MPKRTVRLSRRRVFHPMGYGQARKPKTLIDIHKLLLKKISRKRKKHPALRKWMNARARPWMTRGGSFTSVLKPVGTVAGPILSAVGMPEFGLPISAVAGLM